MHRVSFAEQVRRKQNKRVINHLDLNKCTLCDIITKRRNFDGEWFELKGKSYSIPVGMMFKRHYCSKCGNRLKKERTHRVVTKDDFDYYQYGDFSDCPKLDFDVYDYRFKCPSCQSRISFNEQCIIERIQKKHHKKVLSPTEIKENYRECKLKNYKRVLRRDILGSVIASLVMFIIVCLFIDDKSFGNLWKLGVLFAILAIIAVVGSIRSYYGNYKLKIRRTYSYEKESLFKKIHAYSSHNRKLIEASEKCHCFYCKGSIESSEIVEYTDQGQTAICPKCGIDAIVPDSIDDEIDDILISEMHEYWF